MTLTRWSRLTSPVIRYEHHELLDITHWEGYNSISVFWEARKDWGTLDWRRLIRSDN